VLYKALENLDAIALTLFSFHLKPIRQASAKSAILTAKIMILVTKYGILVGHCIVHSCVDG